MAEIAWRTNEALKTESYLYISCFAVLSSRLKLRERERKMRGRVKGKFAKGHTQQCWRTGSGWARMLSLLFHNNPSMCSKAKVGDPSHFPLRYLNTKTLSLSWDRDDNLRQDRQASVYMLFTNLSFCKKDLLPRQRWRWSWWDFVNFRRELNKYFARIFSHFIFINRHLYYLTSIFKYFNR